MYRVNCLTCFIINVQGELFNLFCDSGCGDLVCKKSAIDKLIGLGKGSRELPGPIILSGVLFVKLL